MKKIKFSVITVVFNGELVIRKTIESVLSQTMRPFEYWIIDGKSTDNTCNIVEGYRSLFENKGIVLNILSEKDNGIYNAMNKGIQLAKGDFISFINAGDWYERDALEQIQKFYNEQECDLIYGHLNYIRPDGSVVVKKSRLDRYCISSRNWNHPSMFLKSIFYKKYLFNEEYKIYADFELYIKLRKNRVKTRVIDKVITNFVADGISTQTEISTVLKRAKEKYNAYRVNDYNQLYWVESYFWEFAKAIYFKIFS